MTRRNDDAPRARFDLAGARRTAEARGESLDQVLDRNLSELLQELRVAITGVQVLFAFLLGLAFTSRFAELGAFDVTVYTVTLMAAALATVLLIAPVSVHRLVFRRGQKATLVLLGDRLLRVGLAMLVVAIGCATLLVLDVALGRIAGAVGGGAVLLTGALTWYALPLRVRRREIGDSGPTGADTDPPSPSPAMDPPPQRCDEEHPR